MLNDDDFLAYLLPQLRAKRTGQYFISPSAWYSTASPKTYPPEIFRKPDDAHWFPIKVNETYTQRYEQKAGSSVPIKGNSHE